MTKKPDELPERLQLAMALRILRKEGLNSIADRLEGSRAKGHVILHHFYDKIQGWFVNYDLYRQALLLKPKGSHFVEVNSEGGRGAAFFAVEMLKMNKQMRFDAVCNPYFSPTMLLNLESVRDVVTPIISNPQDTINLYEDNSLDFVMLAVIQEGALRSWYSKLKPGGWLAGGCDSDGLILSLVRSEFADVQVLDEGNSWKVVRGFRRRPVTMVVTAFKIDDKRIQDFFTWNQDVLEKYDVAVNLVVDRPVEVDYPPARVLIMPETNLQEGVYSLSKGVNYGVKRVVSKDADSGIVIKTDIDIVIGDALMEMAMATVLMGHGIFGGAYYVNNIKDVELFGKEGFSAIQCPTARGGFIAMTKDDWFSLHGFDERMFGWGYEDNDLLKRAEAHLSKAEEVDWMPLFHIAHETRSAAVFPNRVESNHRLSDGKWSEFESWGEG